MPRGVKAKVDYAAEIQKIDERIEANKEENKALVAKRKQLEQEQSEADLRELQAALNEKGLSAADVLKSIK